MRQMEDTVSSYAPANPYEALLDAPRSVTSHNRSDGVAPAGSVLFSDRGHPKVMCKTT